MIKQAVRLFPVLAAIAFLVPPSVSNAEVVDRIIAIINENIITLSELNAAATLESERIGADARKDRDGAARFKALVLENLVTQKLVKQASDKAGIDVSDREIDNAVAEVMKNNNNMGKEELYLGLAQSGLTLKEYREQLKEQIRQAKFMNKEFRSRVLVPDEDVADYYRQNPAEFSTGVSYRVKMIFLSSKDKKMQAVRLQVVNEGLRDKTDFDELARDYSDSPSAATGGDIGYIRAGELEKGLETAVLTLKPGDVAEPIAKEDGIYILKLVDVKRGGLKTYDEVKDAVRERLAVRIMEQRFNFWLREVKRYAHVVVRM